MLLFCEPWEEDGLGFRGERFAGELTKDRCACGHELISLCDD